MKYLKLVVVCFSLVVSVGALSDDTTPGQKAVLITGASTGIGRHLAEALAAKGYFVYAGARKDSDLAELNALDNVKGVRLDVLKQEQIDAAVALVRAEGRGLWGLVNNAGVGSGGPIISTAIDDHLFVYAVNVEGVYRVTRAFAPMIIESKGRIATTGSIAGTLSWPAGNAYSGSKHAIEAFTDALAMEMEKYEVGVSVIEPGNYQSNIRRSNVQRRLDKAVQSGKEVTPEMQQEYASAEERELSFKEPDEVTDAFMHALFDDAPLRRYMVVPNREEADITNRQKVTELLQMNQWSEHASSRDELVALIDELLEAQSASD